MSDPVSSTVSRPSQFANYEDINRLRSNREAGGLDSDKDGSVSAKEAEAIESSGVKPFFGQGKVLNTDLLNSSYGRTANTAWSTAGASTTNATITEMNMADPSNAQRLRAFGLTERQANSGNNMFFDLGGDDKGNHRYGFYSKGHGTGDDRSDERSGILTVDKDGKFVGAEGKSLGADAWTKADGKDLESMKAAFGDRANAVQKYGDFTKYREAQELKGQIGDLLGDSSLTPDQKTALKEVKANLEKDPANLNSAKQNFDDFLKNNNGLEKKLLETKLDEAESVLGKDAVQHIKNELSKAPGAEHGAMEEIKKSLDKALSQATEARNKFDDEAKGKAEIATEVKKFEEGIAKLDSKQQESFKEAQKSMKTADGKDYRQDKEVLNELRLQNARLAKLAPQKPEEKKPEQDKAQNIDGAKVNLSTYSLQKDSEKTVKDLISKLDNNQEFTFDAKLDDNSDNIAMKFRRFDTPNGEPRLFLDSSSNNLYGVWSNLLANNPTEQDRNYAFLDSQNQLHDQAAFEAKTSGITTIPNGLKMIELKDINSGQTYQDDSNRQIEYIWKPDSEGRSVLKRRQQ